MAYKSEYYDAQKAHEYYEKHKKLKGKRSKTSTAGFSQRQKEASMYVKSQINSKKKSALKKHSENVKKQSEQMRNKVASQLSDIQAKIRKINSNNSLSNNQKAELRGALKEQVAKIKEDYKASVKKFNDDSKAKSKNIQKAYDKQYESEHKKIRNNLKKRR